MCEAWNSGSITYGYVYARISSDGYSGYGYAEVGRTTEQLYFYGFRMEISTSSGKVIAYAEAYSTNGPWYYIDSFKPYEKDNWLASWAETHNGTIEGPLDVFVGVMATTGGWCGY